MIPQKRQEADAKTDCYYTKKPSHVKKIACNTGTSGREKVVNNGEFEKSEVRGTRFFRRCCEERNFRAHHTR
jgi:hypothetical protein